MHRKLVALFVMLTACGGLSLPSTRDASLAIVDSGSVGAGGGAGSSGGGAGGGGGSLPGFDAGWPRTVLTSDAFTRTDRPAFWLSGPYISTLVWQGQLLIADQRGPLLTFEGGTWRELSRTAAAGVSAMRSLPEGPMLFTMFTESICDSNCRDGGTARVVSSELHPLGAVCTGTTPLTFLESSYALFQFDGTAWQKRTINTSNVAPSGSNCTVLPNGEIVFGSSNVIRLGADDTARLEASFTDPIVEIVPTRFGLAAIGQYQSVFVETDAGWQTKADRNGLYPSENWLRAFRLPDGRLLAVGFESLSVIDEGSIRTMHLPGLSLKASTRREDIAMGDDGTVWLSAHFDPWPADGGVGIDGVLGFTLR